MLVLERKEILRREGRIRLRERAESAYSAEVSDRAQEHFLREFPPRAGRTAALYCALAGEVPTERIRHAYLAAGARLYYPRVTGRRTLAFYPHREGDGWETGPYGIPEPSNPAGVEPLLRAIRNAMTDAGMRVEYSKGECNRGQHEINFQHAPALETADGHALYKTGAKEIAAQHGMSITFMAKYDAVEGSSCHIHLSLRDGEERAVFDADRQLFERFLAGQLGFPAIAAVVGEALDEEQRGTVALSSIADVLAADARGRAAAARAMTKDGMPSRQLDASA